MSDIVVVDASLAVKWVISEPDSDAAVALLNEWASAGKEVIAPALFTYEATNVIYRRVVQKLLTYEEAVQLLTDLFAIDISFDSSDYEGMGSEAIALAHRFHLPAVYDAHYLALAIRENCEYWTADAKLWNAVKGKLDRVRWIGDYNKP